MTRFRRRLKSASMFAFCHRLVPAMTVSVLFRVFKLRAL